MPEETTDAEAKFSDAPDALLEIVRIQRAALKRLDQATIPVALTTGKGEFVKGPIANTWERERHGEHARLLVSNAAWDAYDLTGNKPLKAAAKKRLQVAVFDALSRMVWDGEKLTKDAPPTPTAETLKRFGVNAAGFEGSAVVKAACAAQMKLIDLAEDKPEDEGSVTPIGAAAKK